MTERDFLRIHIEACWGITVPPLIGTSVDLPAHTSLPPWSLYHASIAREEVTVWRPGVLPEQRATLLAQARAAGRAFDSTTGMRREMVFQPPATTPHASHQDTRGVVRPLTTSDLARVEAFEEGSAAYYQSHQRAPCIGVLVEGRLVCVAHSSRRITTACELGIDTLPDARRHGYATMATITWTQAVRQEGLLPIYSARADNTASLRVAAAAGYAPLVEGVYGPVSETDG